MYSSEVKAIPKRCTASKQRDCCDCWHLAHQARLREAEVSASGRSTIRSLLRCDLGHSSWSCRSSSSCRSRSLCSQAGFHRCVGAGAHCTCAPEWRLPADLGFLGFPSFVTQPMSFKIKNARKLERHPSHCSWELNGFDQMEKYKIS